MSIGGRADALYDELEKMKHDYAALSTKYSKLLKKVEETEPKSGTSQPKTKCDPELFEKGEVVIVIANCASTVIEAMVVRVREETRCKVDWHYAGGRGMVLVLGDKRAKDKVRQALIDGMPIWRTP